MIVQRMLSALSSIRSPSVICQSTHGKLRRTIDRTVGREDLEACNRRDVDDVAVLCLLKVRKNRSDSVQNALDVRGDGTIPFVDLQERRMGSA